MFGCRNGSASSDSKHRAASWQALISPRCLLRVGQQTTLYILRNLSPVLELSVLDVFRGVLNVLKTPSFKQFSGGISARGGVKIVQKLRGDPHFRRRQGVQSFLGALAQLQRSSCSVSSMDASPQHNASIIPLFRRDRDHAGEAYREASFFPSRRAFFRARAPMSAFCSPAARPMKSTSTRLRSQQPGAALHQADHPRHQPGQERRGGRGGHDHGPLRLLPLSYLRPGFPHGQ